jgi:hypothetical protein
MNDRTNTSRGLAVAFILTITFGIAWGILAVGAIEVLTGYAKGRDRQSYEQLVVLENGDVAIQEGKPVGKHDWNLSYHTLDGRPLSAEQAAHWTPWPQGIRINEPPRSDHQWARLQSHKYFPVSIGYRINERLYWYVARDAEGAYFVGYDRDSRRPVAYAGRKGFQNRPIPAADRLPLEALVLHSRWITPDSAGGLYVYSQGRLDIVDFDAQTFTRVLPEATIRSVGFVDPRRKRISLAAADTAADEEKRSVDPVRLGIATEDGKIRLLDADGNDVASFAIPSAISKTPFRLHRLDDGSALAIAWDRGTAAPELVWFDAGGKILKREKWEPSVRGANESTSAGPILAGFFAAPLPEIAVTTLVFTTSEELIARTGKEREQEIRSVVFWLIPVCVLSLLLAVLADRRRKRFGMSRSYAWIAFVFLFGVPGYLAFLAHRRWPALVPCSSCDANTPCNRPACTRCGTAFPTPRLTGTEVFC